VKKEKEEEREIVICWEMSEERERGLNYFTTLAKWLLLHPAHTNKIACVFFFLCKAATVVFFDLGILKALQFFSVCCSLLHVCLVLSLGLFFSPLSIPFFHVIAGVCPFLFGFRL